MFAKSVWRYALVAVLGSAMAFAQGGGDRTTREVRHELTTLPYYGVFDDLSYRVDGGVVTLFGQVTRPVTKQDAEKSVKGVEGVTKVVNNIEVLPVSPMDDQIRLAVYRAIYGSPNLERYGIQAIPSIHILVKNGNVTLTGVVANDMDRQTAGIRANTVPGIFAVKNELRLDSDAKKGA
jgi:hyperosmotically inducible protein